MVSQVALIPLKENLRKHRCKMQRKLKFSFDGSLRMDMIRVLVITFEEQFLDSELITRTARSQHL